MENYISINEENDCLFITSEHPKELKTYMVPIYYKNKFKTFLFYALFKILEREIIESKLINTKNIEITEEIRNYLIKSARKKMIKEVCNE